MISKSFLWILHKTLVSVLLASQIQPYLPDVLLVLCRNLCESARPVKNIVEDIYVDALVPLHVLGVDLGDDEGDVRVEAERARIVDEHRGRLQALSLHRSQESQAL